MDKLVKKDPKKNVYYYDGDDTLIRGTNGTTPQKKDMTWEYIHERFVALDKVLERLYQYEQLGSVEEIMDCFIALNRYENQEA